MNKKILTIDDLMKFCQKNNFQHFSAENDDVAICVQIPSKIVMDKKSNDYTEGLRPFTAKAYHDKVNLNKSSIKKETLESTLPSALLRPILAHIVVNENGEKDFGSHDFTIEQDEDGNEKVIYHEQPVGVIFGENTIEYDEEADVDRAILHGYLYEDYCQDAIDILDRRGYTDCSVELNIRELSYNAKEKVLELEDFYVGGLSLLGATIKPGMAGSNLTLDNFSKQNNSVLNYSETDNTKLIETLEKLNTTLSNFNINQANAENPKEGGNIQVDNEKIKVEEEVTETEEVEVTTSEESTEEVIETATENESEETVEDDTPEVVEEVQDENIEDSEEVIEEVTETEKESEEEVEVKETEACGGSGSGSGKKKKKYSIESEDGTIAVYEVSLDEKIYAIQDLVNVMYSESDNAYYGVKVYEKEVIMIDYWSNRAYKQSYSTEGDSYTLTGDRVEVYATYVTADEQKALDEMKSTYSSISEKLSAYEKAELDARKSEILSDESYAEFAESDEFKEIKENVESLSVDELKVKCELAFAKCVKKIGTYSLKEETPKKKNKIGVTSYFESNEDSSRYGDYFKSLKK